MEKKYQIFISSTYTDLVEQRKKVQDTILTMHHFPVGMELFSSADEEQWEVIQETIDSSDYYVLIIGHRYGSLIQNGLDAGISYTEKEYRYAKACGIPVLAFIIADSVKVNASDIEREHPQELEKFIEDVKTGRIVQWWESTDDLANKVMNALFKQFLKSKRPGWVRADSFNIEESHAELLALNKKLRELEHENAQLKSQVQTRVPKLKVSFELETPDEDDESPLYENLVNAHNNSEGGITMKIPEINETDIDMLRMRYAPLAWEEVPIEVKSMVSEEEIELYNKKLPTAESLENYVNACNLYKKMRLGVPARCWVSNEGTAKANDIRVMISVPDGLHLVEFEDVDGEEEPKAPDLPKNPIEEAYLKTTVPFLDSWMSALRSISEPLMPDFDLLSNYHPIMSMGYDICIENDTADISIKSILHTQSEGMGGCYFVAMRPGVYKVECRIMCAEYVEPDVQYITFYAE